MTSIARTHRRHATTAAAVGVGVVVNLPVYLLGALSLQLRTTLGFDEAGLGMAASTFFIAAALSFAAAGRLTDRLGADRTARVALGLAATTLLMTTVVDRWALLLVACFIGGFGISFGQSAGNLAILRQVGSAQHATAFGIKQAAVPAAAMLAGFAVPLTAEAGGWRLAYLAGAAIALLALLRVGRFFAAPRPPTIPVQVGAAAGVTERTISLRRLSITAGLAAAAATAMSVFFVESAVSAGLSEASAGRLLGAASLVCVAARVVCGWCVDRLGADAFRLSMTSMALGGAAAFVSGAMPGEASAWAAFAAVGVGWAWPGLLLFGITAQPVDTPASIAGRYMSGVSVGAVIGPQVMGLVTRRATYSAAWLAIGVSLMTAAVFVAAAGGLRPRRQVHRMEV